MPVGPLLPAGVLRAKVFEQLRAQIDAEAQQVDRSNRIDSGLSVLPAAEYL